MAARSASIQGTVLLEIVITENGKVTDVAVVSPLGFGLDERAREAISTWKFQPATKDGKPVSTHTMVQVNFRLLPLWRDAKADHQRTDFNLALRTLQKHDEKNIAKAVAVIQDLTRQKFPAAMHLEAILMEEGVLLSRDSEGSLKLLTKAADKNYGPAMYEIGIRYVEGRGLPADAARGLKLIRDAALLGSTQAEFYLGSHYETGEGVEQDPERAGKYFRFCAAAHQANCQFRLAQLLLSRPNRAERDYIQAIAWLESAAEQGYAPARSLLDKENPTLTAEQVTWVKDLKLMLIVKP
jgi:TonB family protein